MNTVTFVTILWLLLSAAFYTGVNMSDVKVTNKQGYLVVAGFSFLFWWIGYTFSTFL